MAEDGDADEGDPGAPGAEGREVATASLGTLVSREVGRQLASQLRGGLYLVATPIGNLADVTVRALATLARCDVIYCEDTRHSRTLLAHYGIRAPLRAYHEHNAEAERPRLLALLGEGRRVGLISDAGTPLVSDPGFKLVREAVAAGHHVESLPGPSAALAALTSSGLPTDAFLFAGFLPPRQGARRARLEALRSVPATLILFEAPGRVGETLADAAAVLGERPAVVARELTKLHEEMVRGSLAELAVRMESCEVRGEVVLVIGPAQAIEVSDDSIQQHLQSALETMSLKDAAKAVADHLSVPKGRVYDIGLKLKSRRP